VLVSLPKLLRTEDFVLGMASHIVKITYRVLFFTDKNLLKSICHLETEIFSRKNSGGITLPFGLD